MSFTMPDLVVESVLREGFAALKRNPDLIDDIFDSLLQSHVSSKYGQRELARIKTVLSERDWSFVHSFGEVESNMPCVSIQLGSETEARDLAHLEDLDEEVTRPITDADQLANLVKVSGILPDALDYEAGIVYVANTVNLTTVQHNNIYVDASGLEHIITGGIDNTNGSKQFCVAPFSEVDISAEGHIKSSIDYEQFAVRGVHNDVQLLLGIHTKDALTTKYFYILVKYFLMARKKTLIERNFIASSYQGSDFTRNLQYAADVVYTRYLTVTGKVQDSWTSEQADIFDNIEVITKVPIDVSTTADLGLGNSTVQVGTTDQGD
jgi:hypothetical protein